MKTDTPERMTPCRECNGTGVLDVEVPPEYIEHWSSSGSMVPERILIQSGYTSKERCDFCRGTGLVPARLYE